MFNRGVHHVSLNVTDATESIRFYVDVLGLSVRDDRPDFPFDGAWLQAGDQQIHLLEVDEFVPPDGQHFALGVDDIDAAVAHLAAHGVEVSDPKRVDDVCRQAFFHDPTGNLIELNQPL
ncbi:VOC family protein [Ilumatobacter nonamiensis]|uniref:VOC family protein n=1 Tax=Ilumatobacter nonamiensis TaxID=467093 RepID=UPI0003495374|nr:VOC family protein [Ilumatobacter nonamiensis]